MKNSTFHVRIRVIVLFFALNIQASDKHIFCTSHLRKTLMNSDFPHSKQKLQCRDEHEMAALGNPVGCSQSSNVARSSGFWLGSSCPSWRLKQSVAPVSHLWSAGVDPDWWEVALLHRGRSVSIAVPDYLWLKGSEQRNMLTCFSAEFI